MTLQKIGVVGAGAWGTALAQAACRAGRDVTLWAYETETVETINKEHKNQTFLKDIALDPKLKATSDLADLAKMDALLMVTPAQFTRHVAKQLAAHIPMFVPIVLCSKGIETSTKKLISEALHETLPQNPIAVLSGPSFAHEVAKGLPAALTLACENEALGMGLIDALGQTNFRLYWSDDIIGAQVGGAVKNVMAIACGICDGKGFGANAHAALTTRGFAELMQIGKALGGKSETLCGLSGLGDLILTCSSPQSRNMSLGRALGQGKTLDEILGERKSVTEGVYTASAVAELAEAKGLDLPICHAVHEIVTGKLSVESAIENLLSRPFKAEI